LAQARVVGLISSVRFHISDAVKNWYACPHVFRNGIYNFTVPEVAVVQSSVTAQKTRRDWDSMTFKFKTRAGLGVDAVFTHITEQRIEHMPSWLLAACNKCRPS